MTLIYIREPAFTCCLDFFDKLAGIARSEVLGIDGYLQSELYWKDFESDIRCSLSFKDRLYASMRDYLRHCEIDTNRFVAISVRRGDFITDPNHYLLPRDYYINAYKRFFASYGVFVFSDDITWCRQNLSGISGNVFFADGLNGIRQLCLMSLFKNFIIANSTFSWWGAYLSTSNAKRVVRPFHHFDGALKATSIADHYPKNWIVFDHLK